MIATVIDMRKTKKAAERQCAWYSAAEPMNHRVIKWNGLYCVVRDWHPSDQGRSFETIDVS